jgi:hypothetical protein
MILTIAMFCTLVFLTTMLVYLMFIEIKNLIRYFQNRNRYHKRY